MAERYLIIADDFTGANDTGVQMRKRGCPTEVLFAGKPLSPEKSIVIDTESRTIPREEAYRIVKNSLADVDFAGFKNVIKKVDSTLRGNIAWEVKAVDEIFQPELIVFAPALPALGRTTVDGVHRLNGVPICKTELSMDPKNPVLEDDLAELLERCYDEAIVLKKLPSVRSSSFALEGGRIFVCDAETNDDLRRVIHAAKKCGKRTLYIGSAGIADSLMETESPTAPALGIAASISSITNHQMRYCEEHGITMVKIPVHELIRGTIRAETCRDEAIAALKRGEDTILLTNTAYNRIELELSREAGAEKGMDLSEVGDVIRVLLGRLAQEILEQVEVSGMFVTGGDTALGILKQIGADGSEILSELLTGIPLIKVSGGNYHGLKMVTKAGAFGNEDAVAFAMKKIKEKI